MPAPSQSPSLVTIFADGACEGNPGPGGWGAIIRRDGADLSLSGGYRRTTNNRMEIMAVLFSLEALGSTRNRVEIVSDSRYVIDAIAKGWLRRWVQDRFVKRDGSPRENADLWATMHRLLLRHTVTTRWIRGHAGHAENEACDRLAVAARRKSSLPVDEGYENARGVRPAAKQMDLLV